PVASPRAAPYRDFIAWLQAQDASAAEDYWRAALRGVTRSTSLPVGKASARAADAAPTRPEHVAQLSPAVSRGLQDLARRERLTLNTVVQGAWAILLGRYCGEDDVVFGATVSIRPPTIPDVEGTLGLLINTVAVHAHVDPGAPLLAWLSQLQLD